MPNKVLDWLETGPSNPWGKALFHIGKSPYHIVKGALSGTAGLAKGTLMLGPRVATKVGKIINPIENEENRVKLPFQEMYSRKVNHLLTNTARLLTGSDLSPEITKKIEGDEDVQEMFQSIWRLALNSGVASIDTGGIGEILSFGVSTQAFLKAKHSLLPDIKKGWIAGTEAFDVATLGLLPNHLLLGGFQFARDIPRIIKGLTKLIGYLLEEKALLAKKIGGAAATFTKKTVVGSAKVVTSPVWLPVVGVKKLFKGKKPAVQNAAADVLADGGSKSKKDDDPPDDKVVQLPKPEASAPEREFSADDFKKDVA